MPNSNPLPFPAAWLLGTPLKLRELTHGDGGALAAWRVLAEYLVPIIGPRGFHMVYLRSLDMARRAFPWLPCSGALEAGTELEQLAIAFDQRHVAEADAASGAMLQSFIQLLADLIGDKLTIQLLQSAFSDSDRKFENREN